ncbi:hypothetical protein [Bacillus thuringiensis]|nr:hypothetical protein [Bacillus thuringiensis]
MKIKKWVIGVVVWVILVGIGVGGEETNEKVMGKDMECGGIKVERKV